MFSLSELLFIAFLALLLIGPKQLPEVARTIARLLNELKRARDSVMSEFKETQTHAHTAAKKIEIEVNTEIKTKTNVDKNEKPN